MFQFDGIHGPNPSLQPMNLDSEKNYGNYRNYVEDDNSIHCRLLTWLLQVAALATSLTRPPCT